MRGEEEKKMHYQSLGFQIECVTHGNKVFNGNQGEFFRGLVYDIGIALHLTGIEIKQPSDNNLVYTLRANLIPPQGEPTEIVASTSGTEKIEPDYAQFNFVACIDGFDVNVETPNKVVSPKRIYDVLDTIVTKLDLKHLPK